MILVYIFPAFLCRLAGISLVSGGQHNTAVNAMLESDMESFRNKFCQHLNSHWLLNQNVHSTRGNVNVCPVHSGWQCINNITTCHRSGVHINMNTGQRCSKTQGSCRMGEICTAHECHRLGMLVTICRQRYGHDARPEHIQMPKALRRGHR